jgi:hypothetical protein
MSFDIVDERASLKKIIMNQSCITQFDSSALKIYSLAICFNSRDSSVGIALGYGLDDRGSGVRFTAGAGNFSLSYRVKNGSGAHPASYPMGIRSSFPGG